ncbi:hypothetical protein F9802_07955 [Bacillus aerolatus]|uniref:Uncharacterized protein n=1 Tax=Bacillus aerolatus TaxID=2653354 RepID=A0A6I1FFM2_9BACI|nr:hypothetical protein [Bacillus aerolatus]KAB7706953.1 hypothetical protein F9802_07955 [Bacillus aerolatus]
MLNSLVLSMFFLYFPEDKTEYIPAVISMTIFMAACVIVFLYIKKVSKREAEKVEEKYKGIKHK